MLVHKIKTKIAWIKKKRLWRKQNAHNETSIINDFPFEHVSVGKKTYGELRVIDFASSSDDSASKLEIGSFCSVASDVTFVLNGEHRIDTVLSFPLEVKVFKTRKFEAFGKGNIVIDDDVWVGHGAVILSGVHIGQGCVIASGSVVTKSMPPYSICAGIPAKVIKKRFADDVIEKLMQCDLSKINDAYLCKNKANFLAPVQDITDWDFLREILRGGGYF